MVLRLLGGATLDESCFLKDEDLIKGYWES